MTLEELKAQRATRKDPADLPHGMTRGEVDAYMKEKAALDYRIVTAKGAMNTIAALADDGDDVQWLDFLESSRKALVNERMKIASPIRDRKLLDLAKNLEFSIAYVDAGLTKAMAGSDLPLGASRLGEMMRAAGYEQWQGSIKEVERRLADRATRRTRAQAALANALMGDDERARQEAEANEYRHMLNALNITFGADSGPGAITLVPHRADGSVLPLDELTPQQRKALERMRAAYATR
jgi:hypothetical protein